LKESKVPCVYLKIKRRYYEAAEQDIFIIPIGNNEFALFTVCSDNRAFRKTDQARPEVQRQAGISADRNPRNGRYYQSGKGQVRFLD